MKKTLIAIVCVMCLGLIVTSAGALSVGDSYYVGLIVDGIPSSESLEAGYITNLITVQPGVPALFTDPGISIGTELYWRTLSTIPIADLPAPVASTGDKTETGAPGSIDVTGLVYILAKYDAGGAGALVWYVEDIADGTMVTLPLNFSGNGISHYTTFGGGGVCVPEPGMLILLGIAMSAVGIVSRYVRKI